MRFLYNLAIHIYTFGIWVASLFNEKARFWIAGRKDVFDKLQDWKDHYQAPAASGSHPTVWFHAASLGEFEQGRPVIEKLKTHYPDSRIVLTFFSPSGYEIRKNFKLAGQVIYLPADTKKNANRFIDLLQPDLAIFIKYDFWFNYLIELQNRTIPVLLISALFRPGQHFFRWYGRWTKTILKGFEHIFVQNESSLFLLKKHKIDKVSLAGDTRIDRVKAIAKSNIRDPLIARFAGKHNVMIGGSTWEPGERLLAEMAGTISGWKFIIAPHVISDHHLGRLERILPRKSIRYSEAREQTPEKATILIIDNIGMLAQVYRYGKAAYIGGGFGKGIHNILEPAAFHLPVIFGPNYHKFEEAKALINQKAAFSVSDSSSFLSIIKKLEDKNFYRRASKNAEQYIRQNQGATALIIDKILKILN